MSQKMLDAVQAYFDLFNAQDAQGIADLYADDATVTDLAGNCAAFSFGVTVGGQGMTDVDSAVDVELPAGSMTIHVIDTFTFNNAGKVTEMKAYWGPTNIEKH